jgi:methylthioribose-1-phosphate isomerase
MHVNGQPTRTIWRAGRCVRFLDQTALPHRLVVAEAYGPEEMALAIERMQVRGAPLIGAAAAYGMALGGNTRETAKRLLQTRPTAVNLRWAIDRMQKADDPWAEADAIADEDVAACAAIGDYGLDILRRLVPRHDTLNILTHCNAGWLATVDWGTALAPIYKAHDAGMRLHVWVDETRPRNQGASLTAWELGQHGVSHTVIVDNAGGHLMQHGKVDACLVGSDRTTRTGDVCNKIGTYLKALAAKDNDVPFYVALPQSTIDRTLADGLTSIPIEERSADEVHYVTDGQTRVRVTPRGSPALNLGFDVTPARLVTGLITERGVVSASEPGIASLGPVEK